MIGYIVVLCLALASSGCYAQAPDAAAAAASASAGEGGAAAAAASVTAGGGGVPGGSPSLEAAGGLALPPMGGPSPNQMLGEAMVAGSQLGTVGSNAGFQIAFDSINTADQIGRMVPVIGGPVVSLFTGPGRAGTQLGQSITTTSLDMTRQMGEMISNDPTMRGNPLMNALFAHKLNRLAPPPTAMIAMAGGDPMALMAAGPMSMGVDPAAMMGMAGPTPLGPTSVAATASATAG